jgi:hypothetical protein
MTIRLEARPLMAAALAYGLGLLFLLAMVLVSQRSGLTLGDLSRDVSSTAGIDPLAGFQSNVNALLWWTGGVVALFAWAARRGDTSDDRHRLLLWLGLLTAVLAADDLLLVHDALAERYLGVGEKVVLAAYALALLVILARFARVVIASPALPTFASALLLFGLSVGVDLFQDRWASEWRVFFEDGFKFLGVVGWTAWLVHMALDVVRVRATDLPEARLMATTLSGVRAGRL